MMNANSRSGHDRRIALPDYIQCGLDMFIMTIKGRLLSGPPIEIVFPAGATSQDWPDEEIEEMNTGTFDSLDGNGNLYAIFGRGGNSSWMPKYVGKTVREDLKKRFKEHLVNPKGTNSKLSKVKSSVSNGAKIAIAYVLVEPENISGYAEYRIISEERGRKPGRLCWNERLP